jgi:signal transduction histidine kinase
VKSLRLPRAGLFVKYFGLIGLLVSLSLIASGTIGLYFSYLETRSSLVSLQREKALTASVRIEQFLRDTENQLGWTTLPLVTAGLTPMEHRRLDFLKLLRQQPAITEVSHLDANGREQLKVSRLAMDTIGSGTDFSGDPRFIEPKKGNTWFGPVYFRKDTEPYMMIAIPEARDRPGVTVVDINLKFIWDVVSKIRIGQSGLAYVVDEKGFLIAHPDISLVLKKVDLSSLPQVREALAAKPDAPWVEPANALNLDSQPVLSAYATLAEVTRRDTSKPTTAAGWRVFVEEPVGEVMAPLYGTILRTGLLILAGAAISLVVSLVLARRMVEPVRALQRGADQIGKGDLTSRIEVKTGDELEDLAGRFNTMTEQLRESYADLEKKVEVRTAELREALSQQTATSDVLRVISSSTTDVMPVFDAIVRRAKDLGEASNVYAFRFSGGKLHYVTGTDTDPEWLARMQQMPPWAPDHSTMSGRVVLSKKAEQIEDMDQDSGLPHRRGPMRRGLAVGRRLLGVPMLRDGEPIGVLTVTWLEPGPVPEKFVRLLQTFADQAVIAVENVRLFNEIQDKSRQLETANKHKSEFLANMSHELRTPLNAIIGFSEVMLGGMTGAMSDKQKEFTKDIRDSGKHLLGLINDILDLSKIEAGRMELDIARFNLRSAMDNALTLVRGRAERHGIQLETRIEDEVGDYDGDERKFKQIMLNLLTNAVKFTPEGGTVTMSAQRANGAYVFSVKDTGIGIAPEDHDKVFEEFRQVGTDYAKKAEGTGLGLTLTRRLVELHGGRLRLESELGKGATFTFNLPLEAETT